jgi:protein TonB
VTDWRLVGRVDSKSRCEHAEAVAPVHSQKPAYPEDLRREGIAGSVVLQASVGPDGSPTRIRAIGSADARLSKLAADALAKWEFRPAACDGAPSDAYVTVTFAFELRR